MNYKYSILNVLLLIALIAVSASWYLTSKKNKSLSEQRDVLLKQSIRVHQTREKTVSIRKLPTGVPMVFQYQIAHPEKQEWNLIALGGIKNADGEEVVQTVQSFKVILSNDSLDSHVQGKISVFFDFLTNRVFVGSSSIHNSGKRLLPKSFESWLGELKGSFRNSRNLISIKKLPVQDYDDSMNIVLEEWDQSDQFKKGLINTDGNHFFRILLSKDNGKTFFAIKKKVREIF